MNVTEENAKVQYWKVDSLNFENGEESNSICVKTQGGWNDDEVVDYVVKNGMLDGDYDNISAEDITENTYELNFWKKYAQNIG